MIITTIEQARPVSFTTQDGSGVSVGSGSIIGSYFISAHGGEGRKKADRQHLRLSFATADELGDVYVHLCLLTLRTLWPPEGTAVRHDIKFFDFTEASATNVELDGSTVPPLRVKRPDGILDRRWSGTIRAGLNCRLKKWGIDARLNIESGDPYDLNLAYKIPLVRLLWRPYAVFTDDNVFGETADHVWFERIRNLSKFDLQNGMCPGPIHISPARAVQNPG